MRCTNKSKSIISYCVLCILICMNICGCGDSKIPLDYKVTNDISATGLESRAEGFSTNIAVTDKDVSAKGGFVLEENAAGGLFDVNGKEVLYARSVHERMNPASLTKVMTAICALKYGNLEDTIICSENITNLESGEEVDAQFKVDGNVYLLTDDMINEINVTYILELTYASGINDGNAAKVKPFIYRDETNNKRWEVHIPMEAPTDKMNFSYFGTSDDNSDPEKGLYYVRKGNYPFSFFLADVTVDVFKNTILKGDMNKHDKSGNEGKSIDQFFPKFIDWSQSNGAKSKDWYKHPVAQ